MKNRVRQLREEQGLTQKQLGEKVNVSRQAINAVETGKFDPSLWLAYDIAQLFIEVEFNFADQHQRILDFIEANQPKAACCQERGRLTGGFHLLIFSGAKLCIKERGCGFRA